MTTSTTATTNTTHTAEFMLDQLQVVKLTIRLWTSSKKLRPEDLKLADGTVLPPDTLASLGTKKTIDPKQLLEFTRIKKEAERICLEAGTRFIGGFANPSEEIPRIVNELDALSQLFDQEKQRFLNVYSESTEHWINQHPDFADTIRNAIEPAASVQRKLVFDYMVFRVSKPQGELGDSLNRHTLSLSDQLFREIAQDAKELIDRSFVGKDSVTGRVLNAFRRMRDKLDSLGFLDYRCFPIVDEIDRVLVSIPKSGPYNGSAYHALFALGLLLSDPDKVKAHGGGLSQTQASWPDDVGQPSAFESVMPEDDEQAMAWPNETTLFTLDDYNAIQYVDDDDDDDDVGNPRLPPHFNRTALSELDATQAIVFTGTVQQPITDVANIAKTDGNVETQTPVPAINSINDMWF
jgi:hypothetical protein